MANQPRTAPVVDFAFTPKDPDLANVLRRCLGKLTSLLSVGLFAEHTLTAVGTAGSTVFLPSGYHAANLVDAGIDEVRLVGYGISNDGTTVLSYGTADSVTTYCTVASLPSSVGPFTGPWTRIFPKNLDEALGLRITLPAAKTCSLHTVALQARSLNFRG